VPTVFISYSHDSDNHRLKALELSNRLRREGVDASIDAYVLHPAEGWPKWMESQFQLDFLIVILSPRYIREFNQEVESSSGARYEGSILSALPHSRGVSYERIAIVCFDDWPYLDIPLVLSSCTRYYVDRPDEYQKLYALLTGQTWVEKPPLGSRITLRPALQSVPVHSEQSFGALCKMLWPLMEENRRIFEDFGPDSGAAYSCPGDKTIRYDLTLWKHRRKAIGANNEVIAEYLRSYANVIPDIHEPLFRKWLSHIDAFALHLDDDNIDYREHQFPREVVDIIKGEL
jgi:hypothetical protein